MSAWYPCENPERPNDAAMRWHYRDCRSCHVAAIATQRRHPDDHSVAWVVENTRPSSSFDDRPCVMHPEDDCSISLPCAESPVR